MRRTLTAAVLAATTALTLGTGVASAEWLYEDILVVGIPNVVGISEQDAVATLESQGIPYTITNKSGSALTVCNVTEQRDKGFRTEIRPEWDSWDQEWDFVEYKIWRGLGLTVVCN